LQYLEKSPLQKQVAPVNNALTPSGHTTIGLNLEVPFDILKPMHLLVTSSLDNASLVVKQPNLPITNIKGQLIFTEDRVNSNQLSGKTLGYPLQAQLSSDTTATHLRVNGATDMPNLIKQFPFLENDIASGGFSYQADLHFPYVAQHPSTLDIASSLQGLTIEGDDYLQKSADASKAFKLNFRFQNQTKLPIYLSYGEHVKLGFLLDTEIDRLHSVHAVLGEGDATILPAAGMVLEIKQPQFKLAQAMGSFSNRDKRWPALRELKLDTQALLWQGQNIGMARIQSQFTNQAWEGSIDSALAKGQFVVPELNSGNQALILNMDMLDVSAISAVNVGNAEETITSLPVIQIDSKQVWWRGVNLGKLSLKSTRFNQGIHFQKIKFSDAGKDIEFTADWVKHHQGSSTMLNGEVRMENFGQFLADLGFTNDLKETRAVLSFTGGWSAAPQQFSLDKLNGQLQIHLHNGRIASIEPGVGRLLGLIALEQWAKRLSLDFSDVYRQGLSFDAISGDLKITNGIAYTDNLLIDAISAKIYVIGSANLLDKTLDQHVAVAPKSSDALPIAGTIMDNVAKIITNTVIGDYKEGYFFGSEYRLSGRCGDVQVTPVKEQDGLVNRTWNGLTDFGWLK